MFIFDFVHTIRSARTTKLIDLEVVDAMHMKSSPKRNSPRILRSNDYARGGEARDAHPSDYAKVTQPELFDVNLDEIPLYPKLLPN